MMSTENWQPSSPITAVIFDCDGTLSAIEGIDELARLHGMEAEVAALTASAMGTTGINPDLYHQRLDLVRPTQQEIAALGQAYWQHQVPHAKEVIDILQRLNKKVYVVSAGLYPAVASFSEQLGVPSNQVFAVDIRYDSNGQYIDFDRDSPLIHNDGKRAIITKLNTSLSDLCFVGDGLNDLAASDLVTRFIGFGGVFLREQIAAQCAFYLRPFSLAGVLALTLTETEMAKLSPEERRIFDLGK